MTTETAGTGADITAATSRGGAGGLFTRGAAAATGEGTGEQGGEGDVGVKLLVGQSHHAEAGLRAGPIRLFVISLSSVNFSSAYVTFSILPF